MLSLKHFILQKRVLNLYRFAIRASRCIPDQQARFETIAWFRVEIERNRHLADLDAIENKLNVVMREVRQVLQSF
ncbi:hypothetical protein PAXRUDRAFT_141957 [Paxillus rubicundulus Ve08.2h10]|uniref:Unplaced genomic scaffold scaffold_257, whole genome shotgun sequence n=1 Tax=Paxillus rubicundulus Ve08.2h10 TaxID=930991 RepID=A0A0D0DQP5_9AGAM|nr:hypothetical protein PAXRUDRAFT_141957 [Paxillus rubicundulus Ve08.2h10]